MPFVSDKQRRYLWSQKPEVARKFAEHKNTGGMMGMWNPTYANEGRRLDVVAQPRYGDYRKYPGKVRSPQAQADFLDRVSQSQKYKDPWTYKTRDNQDILDEWKIFNRAVPDRARVSGQWLGRGDGWGASFQPGTYKGQAPYTMADYYKQGQVNMPGADTGTFGADQAEAVARHEMGHGMSHFDPTSAADGYGDNAAARLHEEAYASRLADRMNPDDPLDREQQELLEAAMGTYAAGAGDEWITTPTFQYRDPTKPWDSGVMLEPGQFYPNKQLDPEWFRDPNRYKEWVGPANEVAQDFADWRFDQGDRHKKTPLGSTVQAVDIWEKQKTKPGMPRGDYYGKGETTRPGDTHYQVYGERDNPTAMPVRRPTPQQRENIDAFEEINKYNLDPHAELEIGKGVGQYNPSQNYAQQLQRKKEREAEAARREAEMAELKRQYPDAREVDITGPKSRPTVSEYIGSQGPTTQQRIGASKGKWSNEDINMTQERVNEARAKYGSDTPYFSPLADSWQSAIDSAKKNKGGLGSLFGSNTKVLPSDQWGKGKEKIAKDNAAIEAAEAKKGGPLSQAEIDKIKNPGSTKKSGGNWSNKTTNTSSSKPKTTNKTSDNSGVIDPQYTNTAPSKMPAKVAQEYFKTHKWDKESGSWVPKSGTVGEAVGGTLGQLFGGLTGRNIRGR